MKDFAGRKQPKRLDFRCWRLGAADIFFFLFGMFLLRSWQGGLKGMKRGKWWGVRGNSGVCREEKRSELPGMRESAQIYTALVFARCSILPGIEKAAGCKAAAGLMQASHRLIGRWGCDVLSQPKLRTDGSPSICLLADISRYCQEERNTYSATGLVDPDCSSALRIPVRDCWGMGGGWGVQIFKQGGFWRWRSGSPIHDRVNGTMF